MASRRPEGAALLVAGHGSIEAASVHTLGHIGEALLATGTPWQIRRLTPAAGERYAADRASLKHQLDDLVQEPVRVAVLAVIGAIVDVDGAPALVTGDQLDAYPEDTTLPLAWIRERIHGARAEQVVVVIAARVDDDAAVAATRATAWLAALGTGRPEHVVAVHASRAGCPAIDALLTGVCGDALDPATGTVTLRSVSAHLASVRGIAVQASTLAETVASSPPLAGLWDVRRSQLAAHAARPRAREPEDLTGHVLPGRFRIDAIIARGSFGTIYRARQLAVERDVAVKVLNAEVDPSSEDGRLFVHEIRSVGRIDHRNVVRIHQADITADGRLFFAMELVDGRDLHQVAADARVPMSRERAIGLVCQLLAGLGAAHDAGLVHADVKPGNALVITRDARDGAGDAAGTLPSDERVVLLDFGLARLRPHDHPAESAGGTPAYMAPEQLTEGRVDARSDLFSAALVLVTLLTGWQRKHAFALVPPLDDIADARLRGVLRTALAVDPAQRFQTARELAAALTGAAPPPARDSAELVPIPPFRHLAALTEADRDRLFGREGDVAVLVEHVLYRRSVIFTAPTGTGKTSLLRAGLRPRLEELGARVVYLSSRGASSSALAHAIWPHASTVPNAIASWHAQHGGKLVLLLDQLEAVATAADTGELVREALAFARWPRDAEVVVVLSIREDFLARLVTVSQQLEPGIPIVRLPPLSADAARAAIVGPLTEARLAIEPDLLDALLADLQAAAAAIGPEMGWGRGPAVYPPHLQLACSVLYDALPAGAAMLTLADYRRLGGFDAIVGEYLERVLDTELVGGGDVIARELFLALVTAAHTRALRGEDELLELVGGAHGRDQIAAVLETLSARGLLVRVRTADGEPGWELVHDSLVPRVLAWADRRDLARRRAVELVRYHLRRSRPDAPSLLGRAELRELDAHTDAIAELDADWRRRATADGWTPSTLVARSRLVRRRQVASIAAVVVTALVLAVRALIA